MKTLRIVGITAALLLAGCGTAETPEPTREPTETPQTAENTGVDACAAFFDGGDRSYEQKTIRMLTDLPEQPRQFDFKTRADAYSEITAIADGAPNTIGAPMRAVADALKPFYDAVQDESYTVNYDIPDFTTKLTDLMRACSDAGYQISD